MTDVKETYARRYEDVLTPLAMNLESYLRDIFGGVARIDRISARPKSIDRFVAKAAAKLDDGSEKYREPLEQIQDQVGARVVVLFKQDVETAAKLAAAHFRYVEDRDIEPEAVYEFSYFGRHFVSLIPDDVLDDAWDKTLIPGFFELQIKTVFQHAWSEASHDVGYKPLLGELSRDDKRALAFASAQAWGADKAFADIFEQLSARRTE
ncbi:GTP pyrophosphokinase family protein [uncultured Brevundimonas sp.]|uniref:GTP pyrophosphokinase n=1 Tax=uncultured Brevundimonas sp. TaxID=213418 RepID=UPI00262489DE|nr:RelA/SpoT domain-containing protein [uncultured Brevundimonas sp.]